MRNEMDAERGLMAKVARGDQAAFTDLAQRYSGKLLAVAGRLLGSRADAEDAVQRAFLQCFAGAAGYDARWAVSTWLYRILTNVCVDELRRRATRTAHDERSVAGELSAGASNHHPPAAYLDLHRALEQGPREARVPLALRHGDGRPHGGRARNPGISVNPRKDQPRPGPAPLPDCQRSVLQAAGHIPFGEARAYAWIAARVGHPRAVRAVGTALGRNPVPLILPCHRVWRSDGGLGGYIFGADVKDRLAALERTTPVLEGCTSTRIVCRVGGIHGRNMRPDNRGVFASVEDARSVGYPPCKGCRPAARPAPRRAR